MFYPTCHLHDKTSLHYFLQLKDKKQIRLEHRSNSEVEVILFEGFFSIKIVDSNPMIAVKVLDFRLQAMFRSLKIVIRENGKIFLSCS